MSKSRSLPLTLLGCLVLACLLPGAWTSALALERRDCRDCQGCQPTVSVLGQASLRLDPDQVQVVLGVASQAPSAGQAARENAQAMERVLAALRPLLQAQDSLGTVNYGLGPKAESESSFWRKPEAYQALNLVSLTLRQPKDLGALLDAAAKAGANLAGPPVWSLADSQAVRLRVQTLALADARAQASALAAAAGMVLGLPRLVDAQGGQPAPAGHGALAMEPQRAGAPVTPMEPGEIEVSTAVSCVYELLPRP